MFCQSRQSLFLITAHFLSILPGLLLPLANPLPLLIQQLPQVLGHIESTASICTAIGTLLTAFTLMPLQRTSLAKVMTAFCNHRALVRFLADNARKRDLFQLFSFFVVVGVVGLVCC